MDIANNIYYCIANMVYHKGYISVLIFNNWHSSDHMDNIFADMIYLYYM